MKILLGLFVLALPSLTNAQATGSAPDRILVRADRTVLQPGETVQVEALGAWGANARRLEDAQFSTTCGSVDQTGRYTAPRSPGTCRITVRQSAAGRMMTGDIVVSVEAVQTTQPLSPEEARRIAFSFDVARVSLLQPSSMTAPVPAQDRWIEIPIHYATRRARTGRQNPAEHYGEADSGVVQHGVTLVSIPEGARPGEDDIRGICRFFSLIGGCKKNQTNAVMVVDVEPLDAASWKARVNQLIGATTDVEGLVYVHGYNNSFADAATRAARLVHAVGFPGVAFTYDWPSLTSVGDYTADQTAADRSLPDFKRFLLRIADSTRIRRIAIVAHSMGTRLVSYALKELAVERPSLKFGPVVLAASDIDSATFVDQLAAPVAASGAPVTLYASSKDRVIRLSSNVVHEARRVGSGPPSVILHAGIDYVDASAIDTDLLGHGYFVENRELLDDIYYIMKHRFPANNRNLRRVPLGTLEYYRVK